MSDSPLSITIGTIIESPHEEGIFFGKMNNSLSFLYNQCSCDCFDGGEVPPPYLTKVCLSPVGSISYDKYTENFLPTPNGDGPTFQKDFIVSYSLIGNTKDEFVNDWGKQVQADYIFDHLYASGLSMLSGLEYYSSEKEALGKYPSTLSTADDYKTLSSISTVLSYNSYWNVYLSAEPGYDLQLFRMTANIRKTAPGPSKMCIKFLSNNVELEENNPLIFNLSSKTATEYPIYFPSSLSSVRTKANIEIQFIPYNPSINNRTDCRAGFTSVNGVDALTIYGRVLDNNTPADPTSRAIGLPKAITPSWSNPAGMYVAKNLYKYNFKTNKIIGTALIPCQSNCKTGKLEFDSYNDSTGGFDIGYKMEVLPMAWDPGFQKYSLCSLFLSLDVDWVHYTSSSSSENIKYTCYQNFMPEIEDDSSHGISANFSYRKSDCFTTSSYIEKDKNGNVIMAEDVSCNFAYYISANNDVITIFTGH